MTAQELILEDKGKVRRDSNLMSLYLSYFKEAYSYSPSCAGCSFNTDWQKFVSFYSYNTEKILTLPKQEFMDISIKKIQGKILSYKKEGRTFRLYDNILTAEFISEYLKNGTKEEISERKKLFNFPEKAVIIDSKDIESMHVTDGVQSIVIKQSVKPSRKNSKNGRKK